MRKGPGSLDNCPASAASRRSGWSEGRGSLPRPAGLPRRAAAAAGTFAAVLLRSALALLAGVAWPWRSSRSGSPRCCPLAVAGLLLLRPRAACPPGLAARAGVRHRASSYVLLFWMRVVGVRPGWRCRSRRRSSPCSGAAAACCCAVACGGRVWFGGRLGGGRGAPLRLAVGRLPWGRLVFAIIDTPVQRRAGLRRDGRREPPAGPAGRAAGPVVTRGTGRGPGWSPSAARGGWACCRCSPRSPSPAPTDHAERRGRPGRRARRRRRHPARPPAGHPQPRRRDPRLADDVAAGGEQPAPTSWSGRRTRPRSTRSATADDHAGIRARRAASGSRSWSAPWSTPAPSTCSTRASSRTRHRRRRTATPSGTRCRSASTSPSATLRAATSAAAPDPARHAQRHPHRAARGSAAPWWPTRSASTSPTTTRSATRCTRGAELLVVQTNNAMYIHTGQIEQQFAISRLRALETGRSVVVAGDQRRLRRDRSRRRGRRPRPSPAPGTCWSRRSGSSHGLTPAVRWAAGRAGRRAGRRGRGLAAGRLLPYRRRQRSRRRRQPALEQGEHASDDREDERPSGRVVMVVPTYNEADNLAWIVGRLRAAAARGRRDGRRRQLARRHRRDRRRAGRRGPPGHGRAPAPRRPGWVRRTSTASGWPRGGATT